MLQGRDHCTSYGRDLRGSVPWLVQIAGQLIMKSNITRNGYIQAVKERYGVRKRIRGVPKIVGVAPGRLFKQLSAQEEPGPIMREENGQCRLHLVMTSISPQRRSGSDFGMAVGEMLATVGDKHTYLREVRGGHLSAQTGRDGDQGGSTSSRQKSRDSQQQQKTISGRRLLSSGRERACPAPDTREEKRRPSDGRSTREKKDGETASAGGDALASAESSLYRVFSQSLSPTHTVYRF